MERPGLLKTVSSVFVFIAAFYAVSNDLGGGAVGVTAAALIAVVVAAVYFLFFGWIVRTSVVQKWSQHGHNELKSAVPPMSKRAEGKHETIRTSGAEPTSLVRPAKREKQPSRVPAEPPAPDLVAMLTRGVRNVCEAGPYDVEPGRPTKVPLTVEQGFTVTGTLEEEDGDRFEWMIVDEDNWVEYLQTAECEAEDWGEDEGVYKVVWKVPPGGPWFIVLEAYGKQLVRVVQVNLRLSGGP